MNYKKWSASVLVLAILLAMVDAEGTKTVVTKGTGISKEQARNDALRMAVEQVAGVKIFSQTEVQDFVAVKDAIITESFGLVTSYKIIKEITLEKGKLYEVQVEAMVTTDVRGKWDQIKVILQQKGNPSVMFCLKETLDGVPTPQGTGEIELTTHFRKLGFRVIDRQHHESTKDLHKQIASLEGNLDAVIAAATDQGADMVVVGLLEGIFKGYEELLPGMTYVRHNYIFGTKIIRTDTSQVVGSLTDTDEGRVLAELMTREVAGRDGFKTVLKDKFVQPMIVDLVETWIMEMGSTGTPITVIITNISRKQGKAVKNLVGEQAGVKKVEEENFTKKRYTMTVYTDLSVSDLLDILEDLEDYPLESETTAKNRVELRYSPEE